MWAAMRPQGKVLAWKALTDLRNFATGHEAESVVEPKIYFGPLAGFGYEKVGKNRSRKNTILTL